MLKIFSSSEGEEVLVNTINDWLKDHPYVYIQSFNYHTYHKTTFASEDQLIHSLIINYITSSN